MLNEIYKSFEQEASLLGDYKQLTRQELADGYCESDEQGDEKKKSQYFSALVLEYWYMLYMWFKSCKTSKMSLQDYVSWLVDGIATALKYRKWRDPNSELYNDPNAVDKCIKTCFKSIQHSNFMQFNTDMRRANYYHSYYLEDELEQKQDRSVVLASQDNYSQEKLATDLVQRYIDKYDWDSALVVDGICFGNAFKEDYSFSKRKLMNYLYRLNINSTLKYLTSKYQVNDECCCKNYLQQMSRMSRVEIRNLVNNTMNKVKGDLILYATRYN